MVAKLSDISREALNHYISYHDDKIRHIGNIISFVYDAVRSKFEQSFDKGPPDKCWNWKGQKRTTGHGRFMLRGFREIHASKLSYLIYKGDVPEKMFVLHKCGNGSCVNPNHLYAGTPKQNSKDTFLDNRLRYKLTDEDVRNIRKDPRPLRTIAITYCTDNSVISRIKNKKLYANVQ